MITINHIIKANLKMDEQNIPKEGRFIRMSEANYKQLSHEHGTYDGEHNLLDGRIMGCRVFATPEEKQQSKLGCE